MHPLEKKITKTVLASGMLKQRETAVVGVSGGPDSMALLHLLASLAGGQEISLVAVYVDHGLRPHESGQEAELVKEQADFLKIPCRIGMVAVQEYARAHRLSVEHAARILRYGFLERVADECRAPRVAVAHTADDQAEEVLLRLLRGTGRKGLAGMSGIVAGKLIRPLLAISKDELLAYLQDRRIPYLLDSSNLSSVYLRNRVRLQLLPHLEEQYNPQVKETLRHTAAILQDEEEILEQLAQAACQRTIVETADGSRAGKVLTLLLHEFSREPRGLQRRILEALCWRLDSAPSFRIIESLLALAFHGAVGRRLHLANGLRVSRQDGQLIFSYPQGKVAKRGDLVEAARFEVVIDGPGSYPIPAMGRKLIVSISAGVPPRKVLQAEDADYLDRHTVVFPMVARSVYPGDRFHPLGAPGSKKVKDFLSEQKIPAGLRWQVPVLEDDRGIAALLGLRVDETRKVRGQTQQAIAFRLEPL